MVTDDVTARLLHHLQQDMLACDLMLSLFSAAVQSPRKASLCAPAPPGFTCGPYGEVDFARLSQLLHQLPRLSDLVTLQDLRESLSPRLLELLAWACLPARISVRQAARLLDGTDAGSASPDWCQLAPHVRPDLVFQVAYPADDPATVTFDDDVRRYGHVFAYHGSALENVHSILHNGFDLKRVENAVFGHGIYLSDEARVAFQFLRPGQCRSRSEIGTRDVAVLLCAQVVLHPHAVRRAHLPAKEQAPISISSGGDEDVPATYYVVRERQYVRISHLLVYRGERGGSGGCDDAERARAPPILNGASVTPRRRVDTLTAILVVSSLLLLLMTVWRTPRWRKMVLEAASGFTTPTLA